MKEAAPCLVVKSVVKAMCKEADVRMSSDFVDALNDEVHALVQKAVKRCEANKRGTLRPQDL